MKEDSWDASTVSTKYVFQRLVMMRQLSEDLDIIRHLDKFIGELSRNYRIDTGEDVEDSI
jgi:hypothetical protein